MTLQTLKIGRREFILVAKRDFEKLAAQARLRTDDYWIESALEAEARSRAKGERPIPFEEVERELDVRKSAALTRRRGSRRRR